LFFHNFKPNHRFLQNRSRIVAKKNNKVSLQFDLLELIDNHHDTIDVEKNDRMGLNFELDILAFFQCIDPLSLNVVLEYPGFIAIDVFHQFRPFI